MRGIRRGFEKGRCRFCIKEEDDEEEPKKWTEKYLFKKWHNAHEDLAIKRGINCTKPAD
jgi:hypothetical protein